MRKHLISLMALQSVMAAQEAPCLAQASAVPDTSAATTHSHNWSSATSTGTHHGHWSHQHSMPLGPDSSATSPVNPVPASAIGSVSPVNPGACHWSGATCGPRFDHAGVPNGTQSFTNGSTPWASASLANGTNHLINFDLASTVANTSARFLHNNQITINVGGANLQVNSSTPLTVAERAAAMQVLATGQQSLMLNAQGSAIGGTLTIGSRLAQHISDLVIPQGVVVTNISRTGTLNLSGNLTDLGSLLVGTSNPSITNFLISANSVTVGPQGLLSTILSSTSAISGQPNLGLTITSKTDIVNSGVISTNGALNLTAAGTISNSLMQGSTSLMSAAANVNLITGSGIINNYGLITSTIGSINISALSAATDIAINATGGTFKALNGINIRDALYTGTGNINLTGGDYLSQTLNIYSGSGAITGLVGNVTGALSTNANAAHFYANGSTLTLANNCENGDPTFANLGDIVISGANTFAEAVSIIAGGNIVSDGTGTISTTNPNQPITLIAGATIDLNGNPEIPPGNPAIITGSPVSGIPGPAGVIVRFSNANGGNIDFSANSGAAPILKTNGSNVTLIANFNGGGN